MFGDLWADTQRDLMGDAVEITDNYKCWWSYVPHFIGTPGYVYAYAYGQLLALSVYRRYEERGEGFVPQYLELLRAGENCGIELTETCAMMPAASVSGLYFAHPEARYFAVDRVSKEQVEDYASRKGFSLGEAERWLSPNLGYEA